MLGEVCERIHSNELKQRYNARMPIWNTNAELEWAYEMRMRAGALRLVGLPVIADLFDRAAHLAVEKAEILKELDDARELIHNLQP